MPQNLFAACRNDHGHLAAKRVRLDSHVQQAVEILFSEQEAAFRDGVSAEVAFDGQWTPDDDELLTIDIPPEAQIFVRSIRESPLAVDEVDTGQFQREGIKALFTGRDVNGASTVLVQRFTSQQVLGRRFALLQHGNAFRQLTEAAFTMDTALTCIVENGQLKFRSLHKLRSIIDMSALYREATEIEVREFAAHPKLQVASAADFAAVTNQISRRLIHSIRSSRILDRAPPIAVREAAQRTGLDVNIQDGRIVMPGDHAGIKALLQFLNESRYSGPLSGAHYITNSRRRV